MITSLRKFRLFLSSVTRRRPPHRVLLGAATTQQNRCPTLRVCFSSSASVPEKLRVAIVGGGTAGMSSALHLAPLVDQNLLERIDVYNVTTPPREIGVGVWSTALNPFLYTPDRPSHQQLYENLTTKLGTWVGPQVGYRVPNGAWLMTSRLPHPKSMNKNMTNSSNPALLFVQECDLLKSLRQAVAWEEERETIRFHSSDPESSLPSQAVRGVHHMSSAPFSAKLEFADRQHPYSEHDYHLIIAADGTHSNLRHLYGGYEDRIANLVMGTTALPSPIELPNPTQTDWNNTQHEQAIALQDRRYTVFRGNSPISSDQLGDDTSFQTWGEGQSMRFATVPLRTTSGMEQQDNNGTNNKQVWFITIDDNDIASEADPETRKALLLEAFADWHDPIGRIVQATPASEILMERAIAHRHSMGPVLNFNRVVQQITGTRPPNSGEGPSIVFIGDAYMTVDPILAQGFTVAMEEAHAMRKIVEAACRQPYYSPDLSASFAFDPYELRKQIKGGRDGRIDRLICLLRATELVQALGQPNGGTLSGALNTHILRPLMRLLPNIIKSTIFDHVLKYSLGVERRRS